MKKHLIVLSSLCSLTTIYAQEVVSTQGESYSNANNKIDFTIGEVVTATGTDGTYDITQGFHQTNWIFSGVESYSLNYAATVFPSLMDNVLNIKAEEFEGVIYQVFDASGRIVMENVLESKVTTLQVGNLASGSYSVTLTKDFKKLKTFKLIKQS